MAVNQEKLLNTVFAPIARTYTERDVMLYALGVGAGVGGAVEDDELMLVYEADLHVLPTMAVTLCDPGFWVADPELGITWKSMLHVEQRLTMHKPLPNHGRLVGQEKIVGLYDKGTGKGAVMRTARTLSDADTGETIAVSESVGILRADGGFGGAADPSPRRREPTADQSPDAIVALPTRPEQALIYRLSGDYNPLHVDPKVARSGGFDRPILHGLCTYGVAGRALVRALCGSDPARLRRMDVRFSAPVFPGETVVTETWRTGPGSAMFRSRVAERDIVVLSQGYAEYLE